MNLRPPGSGCLCCICWCRCTCCICCTVSQVLDLFVGSRRRGHSSLVDMDKDHILTKSVPAEWSTALDRWELYLRAGGRSERTVETRIRHVRQVARGLGTASPRDVDTDMLMRYLGRQRWAAETRHGYYESLRLFYRWLYPRVVHLPSGYPWYPGVLALRVRYPSMYCMKRSLPLIAAPGSSCAWEHVRAYGPQRLPPSTVGMSSMTGLAYPSWSQERAGAFVGFRWLIGWQELWWPRVTVGAAGVSHRSTAGICRVRTSLSSRPSCYGMGGRSTRYDIGSRPPRIRPNGICWRSNGCWGMRAWRQRSVMRLLPRMPCAARSRPPISPVRRE